MTNEQQQKGDNVDVYWFNIVLLILLTAIVAFRQGYKRAEDRYQGAIIALMQGRTAIRASDLHQPVDEANDTDNVTKH